MLILQTTFGVIYKISDSELSSKTQDSLFDDLWKLIKEKYTEKEQRFSVSIMRAI